MHLVAQAVEPFLFFGEGYQVMQSRVEKTAVHDFLD
jgi:hypothetical protein